MLPDESLISAMTLAELSVGPHSASSDSERAARQAHLQHAESDFGRSHTLIIWRDARGRSYVRREKWTNSAAPQMAHSWLNRIRLSTTVCAELLGSARAIEPGTTDAALIDAALQALLSQHRDTKVDVAYAAYDHHPLNEPDEWGDLASWRQSAGAS